MEMTLNKNILSSINTYRALFIALTLCLISLIPAFFLPSWREKLHLFVWGSERKILATIVEDLNRSGSAVSIFKVKEKGSIFIEFYASRIPEEIEENLQNRSFELIQKIEIPGTLDGYVSFMGQATNLAVANLDNDPYLELIVPSYNSENIASLDIIKFSPAEQKYELMDTFDIPEGLLGQFSKESH